MLLPSFGPCLCCIVALGNLFHLLPTSDARNMKAVVPCVLQKTTYHPSPLEVGWTNGAAKWAAASNHDVHCDHVVPDLPLIHHWLTTIASLMASPFNHHIETNETDLLSHFTYHYDCGGQLHTLRSPIEPLYGGLRNPLWPCEAGADLLFKEYLLLQTAYGAPISERSKESKAWIFDLGASTYENGAGGASQKWFVVSGGVTVCMRIQGPSLQPALLRHMHACM